jgi:hypothetical protein
VLIRFKKFIIEDDFPAAMKQFSATMDKQGCCHLALEIFSDKILNLEATKTIYFQPDSERKGAKEKRDVVQPSRKADHIIGQNFESKIEQHL